MTSTEPIWPCHTVQHTPEDDARREYSKKMAHFQNMSCLFSEAHIQYLDE